MDRVNDECRLGITGAWFVRSSRDYFDFIDAEGFTGFKVYNCCGSFRLLVPQTSPSPPNCVPSTASQNSQKFFLTTDTSIW
jgi:hypothetical protein